MRVIDNARSGKSLSFNPSSTTGITDAIDRAIYNRLQLVPVAPLGSLPEDNIDPIKHFIDEMEKIQDVVQDNGAAIRVDDYIGSLGITQYYKHPDNTFKGDLG